MSDPILNKNEPNEWWDYKQMTWERFLQLRQWAQQVADEMEAPVYLVGSVLDKDIPRDLDVSVIFPLVAFEALFGKVTKDQEQIKGLMHRVHTHPFRVKAYFDGMDAIRSATYLDLKFCPDTWWVDRPKMLLAAPKGRKDEPNETGGQHQ